MPFEDAEVLDKSEVDAIESYGSGWVADFIRTFETDYAEVAGIRREPSAFGTTRKGTVRTASNVAHAINKFAETHKVNVLAASQDGKVIVKHFDRATMTPPQHPQGRKPGSRKGSETPAATA
jgi:DNA uptake protein ComE-like DNA-binding protein